jgi:hypothetical protein
VANSQVDHARARSPAHRGDVAQVDRQSTRSELRRADPVEIEMNTFDHRIDRKQLLPRRGREDCAIVAGAQQSLPPIRQIAA